LEKVSKNEKRKRFGRLGKSFERLGKSFEKRKTQKVRKTWKKFRKTWKKFRKTKNAKGSEDLEKVSKNEKRERFGRLGKSFENEKRKRFGRLGKSFENERNLKNAKGWRDTAKKKGRATDGRTRPPLAPRAGTAGGSPLEKGSLRPTPPPFVRSFLPRGRLV
jgi:hypothetical protein